MNDPSLPDADIVLDRLKDEFNDRFNHFTKEEHEKVLEAFERFDTWREVVDFIPTRKEVQIRNYIQNLK